MFAKGNGINAHYRKSETTQNVGGVMDMSMDGSPFIDKTHIQGLYFNGGWCYGGF